MALEVTKVYLTKDAIEMIIHCLNVAPIELLNDPQFSRAYATMLSELLYGYLNDWKPVSSEVR